MQKRQTLSNDDNKHIIASNLYCRW